MVQRSDFFSKNTISTNLTEQQFNIIDGKKILRNTYILLSSTLIFSVMTAMISIMTHAKPLHWSINIGTYFFLLYAVNKMRNSTWGILLVFILTGFLGYTLGPMLNLYLSIPDGTKIIITTLGSTGCIFLTLSAYTFYSRKNLSFMGGFLTTGIFIIILLGLCAAFFQIHTMSLVVSGLSILLMSGFILWQTSEIIHGGESNYIIATVNLYITLFNLFINLLQIFGIYSNDE